MRYVDSKKTDLSTADQVRMLDLLQHIEHSVCWLFQSYGVDPALVKIYQFDSDDGHSLYNFDIVVVFFGYRFNLFSNIDNVIKISNPRGVLEPEDFNIPYWTMLELDHPKNKHSGQLKPLIHYYQQTKGVFETNYHTRRNNQTICQQ